MRVRTLRDHTEPKSHTFRQQGEEFEYSGPVYDHIKPIESQKKNAAKDEDAE